MANKPSIRLTSPRGRMVQGDAFEPNTTDQQGNPLVVKSGPNKGQSRVEWFIAVAYRKDNPETLPYLMQIANFGAAQWPAHFSAGVTQQPPLFGCTHPGASFKIMDGDGRDDNGKLNSEKPGFAGCWVVKYSTGIQAPGVWQEPNFADLDRLTDARMLPRGYFVRVNHTVESNGVDNSPGVYINLEKIAVCADQNGAEIIQSGPSAAAAFAPGAFSTGASGTTSAPPVPGAAPAPAAPVGLQPVPGAAYTIEALRAGGWSDDQIVAGGYATRPAPVATPPLPATPPAVPAVPTPAASTPPVPAAAPATPSPSNPAPPPYSGYMEAPAAPAGDPPTLPAANGATYQQLLAAGWTREMMVQHGMIAA